jgi:hypothetical protein
MRWAECAAACRLTCRPSGRRAKRWVGERRLRRRIPPATTRPTCRSRGEAEEAVAPTPPTTPPGGDSTARGDGGGARRRRLRRPRRTVGAAAAAAPPAAAAFCTRPYRLETRSWAWTAAVECRTLNRPVTKMSHLKKSTKNIFSHRTKGRLAEEEDRIKARGR